MDALSLAISGVELTPVSKIVNRLTMLIVGSPGVGKTTLAATMPGKKLLLNFDMDGPASIANAPDLHVADFSSSSDSLVSKFKDTDVLGMRKVIKDGGFNSIIVDSLSSVSDLTLSAGMKHAVGKGSAIERPAPGAYQARNNVLLKMIVGLLQMTADRDNKVHICFTAHEREMLSDDGGVISIRPMLGGELPMRVPSKINEMWFLVDQNGGKQKSIIIRKARLREPVKTRMFKTTGEAEFVWNFDPDTWKGQTVEQWYETWKRKEFGKIDLPK